MDLIFMITTTFKIIVFSIASGFMIVFTIFLLKTFLISLDFIFKYIKKTIKSKI